MQDIVENIKIFHAEDFNTAEDLLNLAIKEIPENANIDPDISIENLPYLPWTTLCIITRKKIQFSGFFHGIYIKKNDQFVRIINKDTEVLSKYIS